MLEHGRGRADRRRRLAGAPGAATSPRSTPPASAWPSWTTSARSAARPPGRALDWLATRQRPDGSWEEDAALADVGAAVGHARRPGGAALPDRQRRRSGSPSPAWTPAPRARSTTGSAARTPGCVQARGPGARRARCARTAPGRRSWSPAGWARPCCTGSELVLRVGADPGGARPSGCRRCPPADVGVDGRRAAPGRRRPREDWLLVRRARRLAETQRSDGGWAERRRPRRSTCTPRWPRSGRCRWPRRRAG